MIFLPQLKVSFVLSNHKYHWIDVRESFNPRVKFKFYYYWLFVARSMVRFSFIAFRYHLDYKVAPKVVDLDSVSMVFSFQLFYSFAFANQSITQRISTTFDWRCLTNREPVRIAFKKIHKKLQISTLQNAIKINYLYQLNPLLRKILNNFLIENHFSRKIFLK